MLGKPSQVANCGKAVQYEQTDADLIQEMCWDSPSLSREKLGIYSNQDGSYLRVLDGKRQEGIGAEVWLRTDPATIGEDIRDSAGVAMGDGNGFRPQVIEARPMPKEKKRKEGNAKRRRKRG